MTIVVYNTLTRETEPFDTIEPGKVRMYVCGPTVYDEAHVGHAMSSIVFDFVRRYLEYKGYQVRHVMNFTDVDDKIIARANKLGEDPAALANRYVERYQDQLVKLNVRVPTVFPRVSQTISEIITMIEGLIERGHAYATPSGDVYFRVHTDEDYGKLSRRKLEEAVSGTRVTSSEEKLEEGDFALWKAAKPGEPSWDSPWGEGRPGWHIECSAMSMKYLGDTFDIHCGGVDLIFPHHENEIAQSEGATGKPFAKYWMHNGHINVDNKKMSKSEGNFFMVRDILKEYDAEAVRLFMLSAHYRSPINFSRELIEQATSSLERLYTARNTALFNREHAPERAMNADEQTFAERAKKAVEAFDAAMSDDLNTADALAAIFEHVRDMNSSLTADSAREAIDAGLNALGTMTDVLGLLRKDFDATPDEVKALVEQRVAAKKAKDFALADQIRQEVLDMGYIIEDTPKGPMVKKA